MRAKSNKLFQGKKGGGETPISISGVIMFPSIKIYFISLLL